MARVLKADLVKEADAAAERIRRLGVTSMLPVPGYPPPQLREGEGPAQWKLDGPARLVEMDEPVFYALWRYAEAHALQLHNSASPTAREPELAFLRAVRAFRAASGQDLNPVVELEAKKKAWGKTTGRWSVADPQSQTLPKPATKVWGKTRPTT